MDLEKKKEDTEIIDKISEILYYGIDANNILKDFRKYYLKILPDCIESNYDDSYLKFKNFKENIKKKIENYVKITDNKIENYVKLNSDFGTLELEPYTPFFIGRHTNCEYCISDRTCKPSKLKKYNNKKEIYSKKLSRLQCIIIFLPYNNKKRKKNTNNIIGTIRVIDWWSSKGSGLKLDNNFQYSYIKNRKILNFSLYHNQTINLLLSIHNKENNKIIEPFINCNIKNCKNKIKKCIICDLYDRSLIFNCGHVIVCYSCFTRIKNKKCPTCNKSINNYTFINNITKYSKVKRIESYDKEFVNNNLHSFNSK
jgi:hypothetical protein